MALPWRRVEWRLGAGSAEGAIRARYGFRYDTAEESTLPGTAHLLIGCLTNPEALLGSIGECHKRQHDRNVNQDPNDGCQSRPRIQTEQADGDRDSELEEIRCPDKGAWCCDPIWNAPDERCGISQGKDAVGLNQDRHRDQCNDQRPIQKPCPWRPNKMTTVAPKADVSRRGDQPTCCGASEIRLEPDLRLRRAAANGRSREQPKTCKNYVGFALGFKPG